MTRQVRNVLGGRVLAVLLGLASAPLLPACYSELEDKDQYVAQVYVDDAPRVPNQAPGMPSVSPSSSGAPSATAAGSSSAMPSATSSGMPPDGFMFSEGCEDVVTTLFSNPEKCGGGACHGGPGTSPIYLNLGDPNGLRERVVDKPGMICSELMLVDSANPEQSAIFEKLKSLPSCGSRMPIGNELEEADFVCISEWVNAMANGDI